MVASCPSSWRNASTVQKCVSTNYTADPATALPVLDMTENVTSANIYCAMCHGKTRDLHHWNLRIGEGSLHGVSPEGIASADAVWEAFPFTASGKCLMTPSEANIGPDTKNKRLCRAYANGIFVKEDDTKQSAGQNFKNPHCAMLSLQNILVNNSVRCHKNNCGRFPPRLKTVLFVFSSHAKGSMNFRESTVRLQVSCPIDEIYDPFTGRCLPVHSVPHNSSANTTEHAHCQGPSFAPKEFLLLNNNSARIIPHQKIYNNDSYILMNQTLILFSNFSRIYTKTVTNDGNGQETKPPEDSSLTLRIITYVGFSLSIISLLILLVTSFLFAELRTYPGKAVMHLSCAMIAMQSVYFASDPDVVSSAVCAVMGALLHYFILAVFLWMSVIAHSTQKTFSNPGKYSCLVLEHEASLLVNPHGSTLLVDRNNDRESFSTLFAKL